MVPTCLGVKSRELEVPALVRLYMLLHLPGAWGYIYIYSFLEPIALSEQWYVGVHCEHC